MNNANYATLFDDARHAAGYGVDVKLAHIDAGMQSG
jgi:acyl-CoA thioesterase FadM